MTQTLKSLLEACHLPCPAQAENVLVTGITDDSRQVQPGNLFVAYLGVVVDGHRYLPQALERGASAVVVEKLPSGIQAGTPDATRPAATQAGAQRYPPVVIQVPDSRQAFALLCAAWHGFPGRSMTVIGITGTDGKTTTANLLFSILHTAGHKTGMISTVNAVIGDASLDTGLHVTTPDADDIQRYLARMRTEGVTHCVLEVTSHGLAHHRVDGTSFNLAVITNITHEHLDLHGSRAAYRAAKGRLFEMAPIHVLNADDAFSFDYLTTLPAEQRHVYSRQTAPQANFERFGGWRTHPAWVDPASGVINAHAFRPSGQRLALQLRSNLLGDFNVSNVMAASSAALALGVAPEAIERGVAALPSVPGRMERIDSGQPYLAVVDFAHTPNALANCLSTLRRITSGRLICVFGCAGERDVQKRYLMGKVAAESADIVVFTAEDPRRESVENIMAEMARGASAAHPSVAEVIKIADRGEAIQRACALARPGDAVVACGKGHEQSLCWGTTEYAWDDREALRQGILGRRLALGERLMAKNNLSLNLG